MLSVGQGLIFASIPLNAIGGAKKRNAQNKYIDNYLLKQTSMYSPSLGFGVSNSGLGLTLNF